MKSNQQLSSDKKCLFFLKMVFEKNYPGIQVNSFMPHTTPGKHLRDDGVIYLNDVDYSNEYPNSYLDIWYPDSDKSQKRPTVIYIHGGGFIFGDKVSGDPLAKGKGKDVDFCAEVAKRGFNVVSPNYALAPEFRFPVQIEQINLMLKFLTDNREKLGLDTNRIFLGGGSAGAIISEIYGAILSNTKYSKKIGITPYIDKKQIIGLIIDEAALSVVNFEENMNAMLGCWMEQDNLSTSEKANILDATKWIEDKYIPSFINTSNQEIWFEDSAKDLKSVLDKNGTDYEYFYRSKDCDSLNHGYMQLFESNKFAKECFESMIEFMNRQLSRNK